MSKENNCPQVGHFGWNELVAKDLKKAAKFYTSLLGWKTAPFGKGGKYTVFKKGKEMVGGMMKCPDAKGSSHWLPYVIVDDVDAAAKKAAKLRGKVVMPPTDIPTVGRIAIFVDPQGAAIGVFTPEGE